MINVENLLKDERQFLALTSLTPDEFLELYTPFAHRFRQRYKHFLLTGRRRRKPLTANAMSKPTKCIPEIIDKLYFILQDLKLDLIQQGSAAHFEMNQGSVSRWLDFLRPVLQQAIEDLHLQPARDMDELTALFRRRTAQQNDDEDDFTAESLHVDATHRPIGRQVDDKAQRKDYNGKHHTHAVKNTVVCDESRFIHFLGFTWRGAIHDKAMLDEELPVEGKFCDKTTTWTQDSGYQGYMKEVGFTIASIKRKRGQALTFLEKEFNTWLASIRVVVEHAIGSVKRLRKIKGVNRGFSIAKQDAEMAIAVGLHNLRVTQRKTSYHGAVSHMRARLAYSDA